MFLGEKDGEKTVRKIIALLAFAVVLIISVFTNDLHQLVFRFSGRPPFSDRDYSYGILFIVIQGWIIFCLIWMEIMLIRKSRIPGYNTDTSRYVLQADHEKYEILLSVQKTKRPSDSQLQSDICAFFYALHAFPDKSPRHNTFPDKYSYDTDLRDFS